MTIFRWRHARMLFEYPLKVALIRKTQMKANLRERNIGVLKQRPSIFNPLAHYKFADRISGIALKLGRQILTPFSKNFTLVDRLNSRARENGMKIGFLWFGSWKSTPIGTGHNLILLCQNKRLPCVFFHQSIVLHIRV